MKSPDRKKGPSIKAPARKKAKKSRKPPPEAVASAGATDDMLRLLELIQGSNSVELKLNVSDENRRGAYKGLGFDPVTAEPRQVFFFDTPDLDLNQAGVVVRARRSAGGRADTVVKLRPVDPNTLDPDFRRSPGLKIEVDTMPGGFVCSASLKGVCTAQEVLDVNNGNAPVESLFSKEQRAFYKAYAPASLAMNALSTLGPTFQLRVRHNPKDFDRRVTIEFWLYPDGSRIYELSTKGTPDEAFQVGIRFKSYVARCGIPLERQVGTKTSSALNFFSKELKQKASRAESQAAH
jgi:hypothetical protein